jgi:hypothetical protein
MSKKNREPIRGTLSEVKKKEEPFELFKIETGVELPKNKKKEGPITKALKKSLEKLPPNGSFVIKKNQEAVVRRLLKDEVQFKSYIVTIRSIEDHPDYKRVFRLVKK